MTTYLSRSAWTSSKTSGEILTGHVLTGVAFHWPGTSERIIGAENKSSTAARLRGYRNYHVSTRRWRDVG